MTILLDRGITTAPYEQIKKQIREKILSGVLPAESPLPSVREIVQNTGVSLATAQRALNELKNESLIYTKPGRGTFVAARTRNLLEKIHIFLPSTRLSFYMEIMDGVREALLDHSIEIVLHSLDTDKLTWDWKTIETLESIQSESAGVIFIEEATGAVRDVCTKTADILPFVTIEWKLDKAVAVLNDYRESTYNTIDYLVGKRERRSILILKGRDYQYNAREKLRGIEDAAQAHNLRDSIDIHYLDTDFDAISGYTVVHDFLKDHTIDAVFCANDYEAIGVVGALNEAGLIAGKDVSLVGYGDMTDKTTLYFPLTTVNQHLQEMGAAAVAALLDITEKQVDGKAENGSENGNVNREIVIPATLEIRKT